MTHNHRLGLICDSQEQLVQLQHLAQTCGYRIELASLVSDVNVQNLPAVDVWVMRTTFDESSLGLYEVLDAQPEPIIFDELIQEPEGASETVIRRRFIKKIHECMGQHPTNTDSKMSTAVLSDVPHDNCRPAKSVWVLGASTGGPEAVNQFLIALKKMPEDTAFIYVQHIDLNMHQSLLVMLNKHSYLKIENTVTSKRIMSGYLYLVNPDEQVDITQAGVIVPTSTPWLGFYKPSIDQVMAKVARIYSHACGVIIFSGMGDDGASSAQYFKTHGGSVMVQSAQSSTIDSMPLSVMKNINVSFVGSPEQLAQKLTEFTRLAC